MRKLDFGSQFKRDYKLALKRGCNPKELETVIALLSNGQTLPESYRDHRLTNSRNYKNMRECHIQPDWLLIYQVQKDTLILLRTDTHSDLFEQEKGMPHTFVRHPFSFISFSQRALQVSFLSKGCVRCSKRRRASPCCESQPPTAG